MVAEMKDSIHHLCIEMVVNHPSLRIRSIRCDMVSVPDPICRQARHCFAELIGRRVLPGLLGKNKQNPSTGCTHLSNLFHDACYNLIIAQGHIVKKQLDDLFPGITEAQILKFFLKFRPELRNSCVRYADNSPMMDVVRKSPFPQHADRLVALAPHLAKQPLMRSSLLHQMVVKKVCRIMDRLLAVFRIRETMVRPVKDFDGFRFSNVFVELVGVRQGDPFVGGSMENHAALDGFQLG
nr:DUF2889 domain-containing protein [Desulfosarcina cetonica]